MLKVSTVAFSQTFCNLLQFFYLAEFLIHYRVHLIQYFLYLILISCCQGYVVRKSEDINPLLTNRH